MTGDGHDQPIQRPCPNAPLVFITEKTRLQRNHFEVLPSQESCGNALTHNDPAPVHM